MNIRIKAKLRAYTKGILPTKVSELENDEHYIHEAPIDEHIYGRRNGAWENIDTALDRTIIKLAEEEPGLNLSYDPLISTYTIGVRQKSITELELPIELEDDTVYYVESLHPNVFSDGGTAFSDGGNDYITTSEFDADINGGVANTTIFNSEILPLNSKGVYEEWQI